MAFPSSSRMSSMFFFFKQKTAYAMRISDWSSDVCSSDLGRKRLALVRRLLAIRRAEVVPRLPKMRFMQSVARRTGTFAFDVGWMTGRDEMLRLLANRSEERRVGEESVSTGSTRWAPSH